MPKTRLNKREIAQFDRLVYLMDSPHQMDRIHGRLRFREFQEKFTKEMLDAAWEKIKDKKYA